MLRLKLLGAFAMIALLAGCAGIRAVEDIRGASPSPNATPFQAALFEEYKQLALFEADEMGDWIDAGLFASKGSAAGAGQTPQPEIVADWHVPDQYVGELTDARARLLSLLDATARSSFPMEAALAQTRFDCWIEQQEENIQPDHIAACRDEFYAALARLEELMAPGVPMAAPANFVIFFDWDSAAVGDQGQLVLDEAVAVALAEGITEFAVTGYTDSSGPADYNLGLSLRRAEAVAAGLETRGVPGQNISIAGRGEADQAVPTADGVRLQANRRVTIVLQ